jgi:6-phosphogluconolactonase
MRCSLPLPRRTLLMTLASLALPGRAWGARAERSVALIAGGYAREGNKGAVPLRYRPADDGWDAAEPVADAPNASFGVRSTRLGLHYFVEETRDGAVAAFRTSGGAWTRLGRVSTRGGGPCHLALDRSQSFLAVANYNSGNIILFRLDPATGEPVGPGELRQHEGSGPNAERQAGPHAHWVGFSPDNRWLWAVDLGADAVFAYPFDAKSGRLGPSTMAYRAQAGSGPRHLAIHPRLPCAYLVSELANSVSVLRRGADGSFALVETLSTLPPGFSGDSAAGAIALNRAGTRLYVSNRGHDSIAVFAVDGSGNARVIQHIPCGGQMPRFMLLLEQEGLLLVANQRSGRIASFRIDAEGQLVPSGQGVAMPGVAFIGEQG